MNLSAISGFTLFALTAILALGNMGNSLKYLWQPLPLLVVILISFSIILVSFRFGRLAVLLKVYFRRFGGVNRRNNQRLIQQISMLAKARRNSQENFSQMRSQVKDPFLSDAAALMDWAHAEVSGPQLKDLLQSRAETIYRRYQHEAKVFSQATIIPAKTGAVLALIVIAAGLIALGKTALIGKVAIVIGRGLIFWIYGMIISYFILRPIACNLRDATEEEHTSRMIVVEGIMLIYEKLPPQFIEERVNSYLLPAERPRIGSSSNS